MINTTVRASHANDTAADLVIVPAGTTGQSYSSMQILGLPLLRRTVLAAYRAGFDRIIVLTQHLEAVKHLLGSSPATVLATLDSSADSTHRRMVFLGANVLAGSQWLRRLREMPLKEREFYRDGDAAGVIDAVDARPALTSVTGEMPAPTLFAALEKISNRVEPGPGQERAFAVASIEDVKSAEGLLLRGLVKDSESIMSRYVERPVSLVITKRLVSTALTPNAMTLISLGVGLAGAPFFLSSNPVYQVTGALLFLAHSILDGCDGELARLKFMESRWGGLLDFWGDNLVHVVVFLCIAAGWGLSTNSPWPWAAGALSVIGTLGCAGVVYWHTMRRKQSPGPLFTSIWNTKAAGFDHYLDMVARRDFIYAILFLSFFGKAAWFVAAVGVGSPFMALLLLYKSRLAA